MSRYARSIASELTLRPQQVGAVLELLGEGNTIPFIARYRKEATGELDEVQIRLKGETKCILDANDPHLLAPGADESDFGDTDSFVDTCFGADGPSSVDGALA